MHRRILETRGDLLSLELQGKRTVKTGVVKKPALSENNDNWNNSRQMNMLNPRIQEYSILPSDGGADRWQNAEKNVKKN